MTAGWAATNTLRETIDRGSHKGGHHPRCETGTDEGCDCYARATRPARDALALVEAALDAAAEVNEQYGPFSKLDEALRAVREGK